MTQKVVRDWLLVFPEGPDKLITLVHDIWKEVGLGAVCELRIRGVASIRFDWYSEEPQYLDDFSVKAPIGPVVCSFIVGGIVIDVELPSAAEFERVQASFTIESARLVRQRILSAIGEALDKDQVKVVSSRRMAEVNEYENLDILDSIGCEHCR